MSRYGPDDEYPDQAGEPYRPPSDPWAGRQDPWTDLTIPQPGPPDRPSGAHRRPGPPGPGGSPPPADQPTADQPTWGRPPPGDPPPGWGDQPTWTAPPPGGQQWEPGPPGPPGPGRGGPAWEPGPPGRRGREPGPPRRGGREPGPPGRRGRGPGPARAGPRRRRSGPLAALVVVLVLLVAGGVAATLYWVGGDGAQPGGGPAGPPGDETSPTAPAGTEEDEDAPADRIGMGPAVAQPGDCLINEGTPTEPAMRIVACDTDQDTLVYRVLARFDTQVEGDTPEEQDRSAQEVCAGTEDYAHHYRLVAENPDDSFVLCMNEE